MNAGLALYGRYAYVGSRTDGTHDDAGVLVVDIGDRAHPRLAGRIGRPNEASPGESSRELRVWTTTSLLIVLNIPCEPALHRCAAHSPPATVRFYDVAGDRGRSPALVATYRPSATPHEMFLWTDPARPERALLYLSTNMPGTGVLVADVSGARRGVVRELLAWRPDPGVGLVHSLSVSRDGTRAFLASQPRGVAVLNTAPLVAGEPKVRLISPPTAGVGTHSAVAVPGRDLVVATEEVYGGRSACPWRWMHLVDVADPARPKVTGELRLAQNRDAFCPGAPRGSYTYSTHNATPTGAGLVLVSWHAAGLRAVSITEEAHPREVASFVPEPLARVATEDPALTTGPVRVAVWSSPIVRDGLIYVVDVRNGLYILRLPAVTGVAFADGASTSS